MKRVFVRGRVGGRGGRGRFRCRNTVMIMLEMKGMNDFKEGRAVNSTSSGYNGRTKLYMNGEVWLREHH